MNDLMNGSPSTPLGGSAALRAYRSPTPSPSKDDEENASPPPSPIAPNSDDASSLPPPASHKRIHQVIDSDGENEFPTSPDHEQHAQEEDEETAPVSKRLHSSVPSQLEQRIDRILRSPPVPPSNPSNPGSFLSLLLQAESTHRSPQVGDPNNNNLVTSSTPPAAASQVPQAQAPRTQAPPAQPPIAPNGAVADAALAYGDIDHLIGDGDVRGPTLTLITKEERDDTSFYVYMENAGLTLPKEIIPLNKRKRVYLIFADEDAYLLARDHRWDKQIGTVYLPPNYDPLNVGDYFFRTYFAGLGSRDPKVMERVKKYFEEEQIRVSEVVASFNGQLLAIYMDDEAEFHKIHIRTRDGGRIVLKALNKSELSLVFVPKCAFSDSNSPTLFKVDVANAPRHADNRFLEVLRNNAKEIEGIKKKDILYYFPQTRRGSAAQTAFGFLWLRSEDAFNYFTRRAVICLRQLPITFKKHVPYSVLMQQQNR